MMLVLWSIEKYYACYYSLLSGLGKTNKWTIPDPCDGLDTLCSPFLAACFFAILILILEYQQE